MDMRALRWFQQVADGVTLTELSELEHTTQPGISRALARLEAEVGTPLLQRSGRRLAPTLAGVTFKRHVDVALHEIDDGLAAVEQMLVPDSGTVSVAFQPSLGNWLVPDLVSSFRRSHPHVEFELVPKREEMVSIVGRGGIAELELSTFRPDEPFLAWQHLLSESLLLAVAANHPFADRERIDLAECADQPFVTIRPESELRTASRDLINRAGIDPRVAFVCDDLPTIRAFVSAGLGIAIMPRPQGAAATSGQISYLPIDDPHAKRDIGIAWSKRRRLLPAADLFREHVLQRRHDRDLPDAVTDVPIRVGTT